MKSSYIPYRNSIIHYRESGHGENVMLCFHGFGEFAETFEVIAEELDRDLTMIAIDLPHHGATEWLEGNDFSLQDMRNIVEACPSLRNRQFGIMGYSLGGRIALSVFQHMPDRVNRLILLAPDGIKVNFWYWLATQTSTGNNLFRYTMKNPGWFGSLLQLLKKAKMTNESIARFVNMYLDDKTMRERVYRVWTTMRKFKPDLDQIKKLIREHKVPVKLIYGKYDRIISSENAGRLTRGVEEFCEVVVLESGHQLLQNKNANEISSVINK